MSSVLQSSNFVDKHMIIITFANEWHEEAIKDGQKEKKRSREVFGATDEMAKSRHKVNDICNLFYLLIVIYENNRFFVCVVVMYFIIVKYKIYKILLDFILLKKFMMK